MSIQPVLIGGEWRPADTSGVFQAENPRTCQPLADQYPVSTWSDCDAALDAAAAAFDAMQTLGGDDLAQFLERYAERIESRKDELVSTAHAETALPESPRLADAELPRTTNQMRQAAAAAREGSWTLPTIDTAANIRSCLAAIGPVCVFGPNNFPFAFGSISGGDFVAAIAAGNPVIAKANSSHPATTRVFAEEAEQARRDTGMPAGMVQLLYRIHHDDGERLVSDPRIGATGYTGSRTAGLKLKAAADAAGKPIYLELSSVNPVIVLPGAISERADQIADEFTASCLMGTGQFCTNPGLVLLLKNDAAQAFIDRLVDRFEHAAVGTLLSKAVQRSLQASVATLVDAGAEILVGSNKAGGTGYCHANTLLRVDGRQFLAESQRLQTEAFGNTSLIVVAEGVDQMCEIVDRLEGNLTGCLYSDTAGADDPIYDRVASRLRRRVGRLINDKMPTGVVVSPAMNHGGPYPSTGHPGFTAVGIPAALRRFAALHCYDGIRPHRLPACLRDEAPNDKIWRFVDGRWKQGDVRS